MSFSAPFDFVKHGWSDKKGLIIRVINYVVFTSKKYGKITVEIGSLSDGASVPRLLWSLGFSPLDGDYLDAAILHDCIYRDRNTKFTRKQADEIFLECMTALGVSHFKRRAAYTAVRLFGWKPWKEARK